MPALPRPPTIPDVVEEHFEELGFLWEQRESAVFAHDWNLDDLAALENRADAHLEGLRVAGGHAADLALGALAGDDPWAATAAALTLRALDHPELDDRLRSALADGPPELRPGMFLGLRHAALGPLGEGLGALAAGGAPELVALAVDVLAFHRCPAPTGVADLLRVAPAPLRPRVAAALGRFGGPWTRDDLESGLDGGDATMARTALETSARLGMPGLDDVCRRRAGGRDAGSVAALAFLGLLGDDGDLERFESALGSGDPAVATAALAALGALGRTRAVPLLMAAMRDEAVSAAAGRAFVRITGGPDPRADRPLPPPPGVDEDEADFLEPEFPADPDKAAAWWDEARSRFDDRDGWYQNGIAVDPDEPLRALDELTLESRRDVWLGARAYAPEETPDLELEARAALQRRR